ncbi:MAG TPA: hypothetical protein VJS66_07370 [Burkholderiales bacterium]|nr:hypothetical protein [Burkholderiales bacterium]
MTTARYSRSRGFSLVASIFVLVVLTILGIFIITIGEVQRATVTAAIQGARAYYAAQSGLEWGVHRALNNGAATCNVAPTPAFICGAVSVAPAPVITSFPLTVAGLNEFTVTVACDSAQHIEQGITYTVYSITSTACFGDFTTPDFVQRSVTAAVTSTNAP